MTAHSNPRPARPRRWLLAFTAAALVPALAIRANAPLARSGGQVEAAKGKPPQTGKGSVPEEGLGEEGYADSGGVKIHYVTLGKGPLVIMVHGFPDSELPREPLPVNAGLDNP